MFLNVTEEPKNVLQNIIHNQYEGLEVGWDL